MPLAIFCRCTARFVSDLIKNLVYIIMFDLATPTSKNHNSQPLTVMDFVTLYREYEPCMRKQRHRSAAQ